MNRSRGAAGFSIIEALVTLAVLSMGMSIVGVILVQNSRINRATQLQLETQANARNCLALVVQVLRTAGWDPLNSGFDSVAVDPDLTDDVSFIEIFADLDGDGDTDEMDEAVLIRHTAGRLEWRRSSNVATPFETLGVNISNDADGDGVTEPLFTPNATPDPTVVTVRITAQAPIPDPRTGQPIRVTMASDVVMRSNL